MLVLTERRNRMNRTRTVVFGALMLALSFPSNASAQDRKADPDWSGPMQQDAMNLSNSGVVGLSTVDCRDVTTTGSTPGVEIVNIDQLEPLACITAFRHLHSTTVPQDTDFPIIPVIND